VNKYQQRDRRSRRTRAKIKELRAVRLTVHRSNSHIYAQLLSPDGSRVLASASTLDKALRDAVSHGGNKTAAAAVGRLIAERAAKVNVNTVAFDRSGYKYHGRIAALADAAREAGMKF
jgi:large subunit ribosomal protein L18